MREFIGSISHTYSRSFESFFLRLPNMGRKSADHVLRVLKLSGIPDIPIEIAEAEERVRIARARLSEVVKTTNDVAVKDAWDALTRAEAELQQMKRK